MFQIRLEQGRLLVSSSHKYLFLHVSNNNAGGGFSGFWFHLGYLQSFSLSNLQQHEFYCYSSGCLGEFFHKCTFCEKGYIIIFSFSHLSVLLMLLGVLLALQQTPLDKVIDAGFGLQSAWERGIVSRFELIDKFFDEIIISPNDNDDQNLKAILPNIKVLVTSAERGVAIEEAKTADELRGLIIKTTWV
jgi:hypothetical protein